MQSPFLDAESFLPPVAERLPLVPLVMEAGTEVQPKGLPYLELGTHGGQLWVLQPEEAAFDSLTFMLAENFLGVPGEGMQGLVRKSSRGILCPSSQHPFSLDVAQRAEVVRWDTCNHG